MISPSIIYIMQPAEKLTVSFVLKIALLFSLLISGVLLKVPRIEGSMNAQNVQRVALPPVYKPDVQEKPSVNFEVAKQSKSTTVSI